MAALIGAGISGIGGLIGSGKEASAIKSAAQTQANAAEYAANLQNAAEQQVLGYAAPYRSAGNTALSYLSSGTAPGGEFNSAPTAAQIMANDPGYQFNLNQGLQAVERAAAAGGGVGSGGALEAGSQYATNYTTNAYQNAYNQFLQNRQANFGNLAALAGLGESATGLSGNIAMTGAANQGNYLTQAAAASGAGQVGAAGVWGNQFSQLGALAQQQIAGLANNSGYNGPPVTMGDPSASSPLLNGFLNTPLTPVAPPVGGGS
jgi:hypothetical protein